MAIQTKFLPRLENDPQSGSIIFTTDGNQISDFTFTIDYPEGLLNSFLLQNAGRTTLNGMFNYVSINDQKPYYTKGEEGFYYIIWINNRWDIYDFSLTSDAIYFSNEDTNYPWQVSSWTAANVLYNPTPTASILDGFGTNVGQFIVTNYPPFNGTYLKDSLYGAYIRTDGSKVFWFDALSASEFGGQVFGWRLTDITDFGNQMAPSSTPNVDLVNIEGRDFYLFPFNNWYTYANWESHQNNNTTPLVKQNIVINPF